MKRKIAAILAADIAGYSRLVAEDEEDTLTRLGSYREVFDDFIKRAGGRIFNTAGDSVLAEFTSAVEATRCAIDIQESLRTRNLGFQPSRQMLFRIGLSIGDVVEREGDLLGDGVNIAARLEGLAEPGGICVSRSVYEQVANKLSVPFRDIGMQEVKNIPQPVHAFRVEMWSGDKPGPKAVKAVQASGQRRASSPAALLLGLAGLALGATAIAISLWRTGAPPPAPVAQAPAPPPLAARPENAAPAPPPETAPTPPASSAPVEPQAAPAQNAGDTARATIIPPGATPAEAFAILARSGGIVQEAKTAPELYHNARSFEARGDSASARRDYLALANLGGDAIDPHLRFAALLRAQDGRAGAREVYGRLAADAAGRAAPFTHAQQFDGEERRRRVEALVAAHPDYAPGQLMLAEEFSAERQGVQTIADKKRALELHERFLEAEAEGRLAPFFLDQSVLTQWVDRARATRDALRLQLQNMPATPTAVFQRSNAGWMVSIAPPEAATALYWRFGPGDFVATGHTAMPDPRTGKPAPNPTFELPSAAGAGLIEVRYDDASGRTQGPFPIPFDPRVELLRGQRAILEQFGNSWVSFGGGAGRADLLYYTQLMSFRCAIARAEIGFGDAPASIVLPMPPCNERAPHAIPSDARPYVNVPLNANTVSVRLTWADSGQTVVKRFSR